MPLLMTSSDIMSDDEVVASDVLPRYLFLRFPLLFRTSLFRFGWFFHYFHSVSFSTGFIAMFRMEIDFFSSFYPVFLFSPFFRSLLLDCFLFCGSPYFLFDIVSS